MDLGGSIRGHDWWHKMRQGTTSRQAGFFTAWASARGADVRVVWKSNGTGRFWGPRRSGVLCRVGFGAVGGDVYNG